MTNLGEVATHSALPSPSPYNIDAIALVVNEQVWYQNQKGVWTAIGQNLVDMTDDGSTLRQIAGSPLPMATVQIVEIYVDGFGSPVDENYLCTQPVIKAPGSYVTDSYDNFNYYYDDVGSIKVLNQSAKQKFFSFPLYMLFYHGLYNTLPDPTGFYYPFSSPFQIDPNNNIIGPWDLSLIGTRSLFTHFFGVWNAILKTLVKYTVTLYPKLSDTGSFDLYSIKSLLQQRMIPYSATYYEPFDGQVSLDVYKIKDTTPNITTSLVLVAGLARDIDGFYQFSIAGSTVANGSGSYSLEIGDSGSTAIMLTSISGPATGSLVLPGSTFLPGFSQIVRAAQYGQIVYLYLRDATHKTISNRVNLTMPAINTAGSISLVLSSSGGSLIMSGITMSGTSGVYRLEIRDTSDILLNIFDWSGSTPTSVLLSILMLTPGTTYHFTLYDTSLIISNVVVLTV